MHCQALWVIVVLVLAAGCGKSAPAASASESARPLRILSLTPNITEVLFAMGLGDKVVGRSTFCAYPPAALAVPAVGDTLQLSLEKVIRLEPTLCFMITRREAIPRRLQGLGIRTVSLDSDTMQEMLESIRTIGRETHREDAAGALVARIQADLDDVRRRVAGLARKKVLFAFPMTVGSSRIMVAGRGTFVDELLSVAGAENAYPDRACHGVALASRADWPSIGPQQVVALAPDVVVINAAGDDAPADRIDAIRRAWRSLPSVPAVAGGRVHVLTESYLTIPGPRVGQAARLLAETIHPELRQEPKP